MVGQIMLMAGQSNLAIGFNFFFYAAAHFTLKTVTASAESVDGSTPADRVTWSTTVPPECVASVRVDFRISSHGPVVANYTTNDASGTAVIQTGVFGVIQTTTSLSY